MAYEVKPNSGSLFPNQKKADNHPDMKGGIALDVKMIQSLIDRSDGNTVQVTVAAWKKVSSKGLAFLSLSVSEPYVKPQPSGNPWE